MAKYRGCSFNPSVSVWSAGYSYIQMCDLVLLKLFCYKQKWLHNKTVYGRRTWWVAVNVRVVKIGRGKSRVDWIGGDIYNKGHILTSSWIKMLTRYDENNLNYTYMTINVKQKCNEVQFVPVLVMLPTTPCVSMPQSADKHWYIFLVSSIIIFQCITTNVYAFHEAPEAPPTSRPTHHTFSTTPYTGTTMTWRTLVTPTTVAPTFGTWDWSNLCIWNYI